MKFFDQNGETDRRPTADELALLLPDAARIDGLAHLHEPGQGWHFCPGEGEICHNGSYWFATVPTSEAAILAHLEQVCRLEGLDLEAIYRKAYPDEDYDPPDDQDRALCVRPATIEDVGKIMTDLEDVNYHSLSDAYREARYQAYLAEAVPHA